MWAIQQTMFYAPTLHLWGDTSIPRSRLGGTNNCGPKGYEYLMPLLYICIRTHGTLQANGTLAPFLPVAPLLIHVCAGQLPLHSTPWSAMTWIWGLGWAEHRARRRRCMLAQRPEGSWAQGTPSETWGQGRTVQRRKFYHHPPVWSGIQP